MSSIFTKIINREEPAHIVWEDDDAICILPDGHFVNQGHLLVIPKVEVDYIFDLEDRLYHKLWDVSRAIAEHLRDLTGAMRIGIAVEGFSVSHVHIHLCPINEVAELDPHRDVEWSVEERNEFTEKMKLKLENCTDNLST